jgi:hypothetical protein
VRRRIKKMSEQAQKVRNKAISQWAEGLHYNKGLYSEVLVYHDEEAIYVEARGQDSSIVRLTFEMLETLKTVIEEQEDQDQTQREPTE